MPFTRTIGLRAGLAAAASWLLTLLARGMGLLAGLLVVACAVQSWAIASTGPALGADVSVVAVAPGELALSRSGTALQANGLKAGSAPVGGSLKLRNITGAAVRVRVRALPSNRQLDRILRFTASGNGRRIAGGPLGDARRWSARSFSLAPGASAPLTLQVALGPGGDRVQGLITDVALEFRVRAVRR